MKTILKLGRWCHPSSEFYKNNCDQLYKMALANYDNCFNPVVKKIKKPVIKEKSKKDPVSALFCGYSGY